MLFLTLNTNHYMKAYISLLLLCVSVMSWAAKPASPIRINQVGYTASEEKTAVVESSAFAKTYRIVDYRGREVWRGGAAARTVSPLSGKERETIDFSSLTRPGTYTFLAGCYRQTFTIADHPMRTVAEAALHAFRLQRCQHPDTLVRVHPSAAGPVRQADEVLSSPGGWYDAGDYNKYIVNSGFSHGVMLSAYELMPDYFRGLAGDFLAEQQHNLRWMLTMQDPDDGGVYHKLTTPNFEEHIPPSACRQPRYVVQKSTQAALDFAAAMAMAARVYASVDTAFSATTLAAAERAFAWAVRHPDTFYDQPGNNLCFDPDCTTGMYDDNATQDEFFWAAAELYITTRQSLYAAIAEQFMPAQFSLPVWGDVATLATWSMIAHRQEVQLPFADTLFLRLTDYCRLALEKVPASSFHSPHGNRAEDFCWGSNGENGAGQGIAMLYAYRLTGDRRFYTAALENADYLLGRNATGYCYVTGLGVMSPMNPHHRLSDSDEVVAPLPGFLVGGPNAAKQDATEAGMPRYPEAADECYLDVQPSYASNEVAINWNAYLLALSALLDAMQP